MQYQLPSIEEKKLIFINHIEIAVFDFLIKLRRKRDKRNLKRTARPSNKEMLDLLMKLKQLSLFQMRLINQIYFNTSGDIIDIQILDMNLFDTVNEVVDILLFINNERANAI